MITVTLTLMPLCLNLSSCLFSAHVRNEMEWVVRCTGHHLKKNCHKYCLTLGLILCRLSPSIWVGWKWAMKCYMAVQKSTLQFCCFCIGKIPEVHWSQNPWIKLCGWFQYLALRFAYHSHGLNHMPGSEHPELRFMEFGNSDLNCMALTQFIRVKSKPICFFVSY